MQLIYAGLSSAGRVRPGNEDSLDFWQPSTPQEWHSRGAAAILADGVGGHGHGEVASKLACEHARRAFISARPASTPSQLVWQMFTEANLHVFDAGMKQRLERRMMTTLTISVFRHNQVFIGHVGDCRAYAIQGQRIRRITSDHSYAGVQLKLGLITVQEAMNSEYRSVLTRTLGMDPVVRADYHSLTVSPGDLIVQATDGLWCYLTESEIHQTATHRPPEQACRELIELAEKRGGEDNLSVQVIRVDGVERPSYYRGLTLYQKVEPAQRGHELEAGQTLDLRYQITDQISRSGMASIFKAIDTLTGRTVALKVPFMQYESDSGFSSRFQREQQIGRALNHPYILRLEEPPENQGRPYLVMEYLEGQTLGHVMRTLRPMPVKDALRIAGRVCEALHYMHAHEVVHRDLKPENIMICNDGSIRIMDFGIAKYEGVRRLTFGGFTPAMGTPDYMAPEQVKGRRGDARTDIYSLGAILYEMVTGTVPFEGANPFLIMTARLTGDAVAPRQRNREIPPEVEEIILHALSRNPGDRYPSANAMKDELDRPDLVQMTGRAARLQAPKAWKSRWRGRRIAAAAVVISLLIWAIVAVARHLRWQ